LRNGRAGGIVDEDQITFRRQRLQSIPDGLLTGISSSHDGAYLFEFGRRCPETIELFGSSDDDDVIYRRV
jgi:hypothetical protein